MIEQCGSYSLLQKCYLLSCSLSGEMAALTHNSDLCDSPHGSAHPHLCVLPLPVHLSGTQKEADKVAQALFDLKLNLCLQEGWGVGRAGRDLFWPFLVSWQVSGREHMKQGSWSLMKKKSLIFKSCTLTGRLWQPCGTHMLGFGMAMSWEVWNTCPPRLSIGSWGQLEGFENSAFSLFQGGALLVYYHGAIPVDYYYLVNRVLLLKDVMVRSVVDKFLFKVWKSPQQQESKSAENFAQVPGFKLVLEVFHCTPGTVDSLAEQLKAGQILVRHVDNCYFFCFLQSISSSL